LNKNYASFILLLIVIQTTSFAQKFPHIDGNVKLSMKTGQITCQFNISNIPEVGKDYMILLNRGFNIHLIKDSLRNVLYYNGHFQGRTIGEGIGYWLATKSGDTISLPSKLSISYTGAFPIYRDTLNAFDYKGVIAFNGSTLRATEQSKWYPIIYDLKNDKEYVEFTYNLSISCSDCKTIYINGSDAKAETTSSFVSKTARSIFLFAGDYESQIFDGIAFLNADLNKTEALTFSNVISEIKAFYVNTLGIPYNEKITFIKHHAIEPFDSKRSWGFASFPSIAIAGKLFGFKEQVDTTRQVLRDTLAYAFYAHELGHYYFGTLFRANSLLKHFIQESVPEYLSIKASENRYGEPFITNYLQKKKILMANKKFIPLNRITHQDEISSLYRYNYGPLVLLGLEKIIGKEKVYNFLSCILNTKTINTDYSFLKEIALKSGVTKKEWGEFETQIVILENPQELIEYLKNSNSNSN